MIKIAFMGAGGIAERMAPTLTGMIFDGDHSVCRYAVDHLRKSVCKSYARCTYDGSGSRRRRAAGRGRVRADHRQHAVR